MRGLLHGVGTTVFVGLGILAGAAVWLFTPHHRAGTVGSDSGGLVTVALVLYLLYASRSHTLSLAVRRAMVVGTLALLVAGGVVSTPTRGRTGKIWL